MLDDIDDISFSKRRYFLIVSWMSISVYCIPTRDTHITRDMCMGIHISRGYTYHCDTGPLNVLGPVYKERGLPLCKGSPWKRVKVSSGLQANFTGRATLAPEPTLPALLTCFVMCDILCNGLKFEIMLMFFMENTLNSQKKKGKYYRRRQKITFFFSRCLELSSEIG